MALVAQKETSQVTRQKDDRAALRLPTSVDVGGDGHTLSVNWAGVAGATKAVVDSAAFDIGPDWAEKQFPDLLKSACSNADTAELAVPPGWRLRTVTLQGLKLHTPDGTVDIADDLHGTRLVVSLPGQPPLYAVPSVGPRGMIPRSLSGASFGAPKSGGAGVLTLPFLGGDRIQVSLVKGDFMEEFQPQKIDLASAPSRAFIPPRNLTLTAPDGSTAWAFPNEMPPQAPTVNVDLRFPLEKALNDRLKAKNPLIADFILKGDDPGTVDFRMGAVHGALLRVVDGVTSSELEGDPVVLDLGDPLDNAAPQSALADLTVKYAGIRILETVSDPLPEAGEEIGGCVVTAAPVLRSLPPKALTSFPVARIGLVGRAPEACELSIQMVEMPAGVAGKNFGAPGVLKLTPSEKITTVWVDFPTGPPPTVPIGFSVRANKGRFFWVSREAPLLRVAVLDPDPGGRPLHLAGQKIRDVNEPQVHLPATSLPAAVFRASLSPLLWDSPLFLRVDLSDLTLRYPR